MLTVHVSFQISDSVVQRLKEEMTGSTPSSEGVVSEQKQKEQHSAPPPPPEPKESPMTQPPAITPPPVASHQENKPAQDPVIQYVDRDSSLSSLRVRAEKERELAEAETYWRKRFARQAQEVCLTPTQLPKLHLSVLNLKFQHTGLAKLEVDSLAETAGKLEKSFFTQKSPPICQQERDFVLQCYKQNKSQPLLCSESVKKFSQCVSSARLVSRVYQYIYTTCTGYFSTVRGPIFEVGLVDCFSIQEYKSKNVDKNENPRNKPMLPPQELTKPQNVIMGTCRDTSTSVFSTNK